MGNAHRHLVDRDDTMSSDTDSGESDSPLDVFTEANSRFQQRIERINENAPTEKVNAVDSFISAVAEVNPRESLKRQVINIVADNVDFMTKSAAERQLNEEMRSSGGPDDRPDIRDLLDDGRVGRIEKLASEDTESETRYRFVFSGGDSMVIDSETLYSPTQFRRAYNGVYDTLPRFDGEIEDWENFLSELQDEHLIVKSDAVGPRAAALTKLRSKVESSEAYIDRADAIRKGQGILIDSDSMEAARESGTIWVLYDEIKRICDDLEITVEAFRIELDSRDLRSGSSEQKRFDGRRATFWPLVREEFEPKLIEPPEGFEEESEDTESETDEEPEDDGE
jgi:hypothetical protein